MDILDPEVYMRKKAALEKCADEFDAETLKWEIELLNLSDICQKHGFLPVLESSGEYRFSQGGKFCPGTHMQGNTVFLDAEEGTVSMSGWDDWGEETGLICVRIADLFREDREAYFLALSAEQRRVWEEMAARKAADKAAKEAEERTLYEQLKAKYGT